MLNKHPNSNCIYNEIRWTEGDREKNDENSKQLRLEQLREQIMEHPAFNNCNTHLHCVASEHGFNVLFCPKYHCEFNQIEGVWCFLKGAINEYKNKDLNIKLWNRLKRALEMYQSGESYLRKAIWSRIEY
ncbi:unnamed protein product [Brachionus calyciflorus]|uniref:Tc1-like transposase DDE domain-containing protein n=1 Tax=Brachionus calyciflorus TaxID=104777 RepID=A0A813TMC0_9BILA|nr:unnamed protein product [Brachionus calyciflorus]